MFNSREEKFVKNLQPETRAKFARMLVLLEKFGADIGPPHSKKITDQIFELRLHGAQAVRFLYAIWQGEIVILNGFKKQHNKLPIHELTLAEHRLRLLDSI